RRNGSAIMRVLPVRESVPIRFRGKAAAMPALATITVGVLSQKSGVSIETIRSYARMGLISKPTAAPGGLRLYRTDDVGRITFIKRAEDLGFSFSAIRELADRTDTNAGTCADVYRLAERDLTDISRRRPDGHKTLKAGLLRLMASCPLAAPLESCTILQVLSAPDPATTDGEPVLADLVATLERIEAQVEALLLDPDSGHLQATFVEIVEGGYAVLHHGYNLGSGFDFLQDRIVRQCEQLCSQMTDARSGAPNSPLLPALRRLNDMIKGLFTQI
ncbi:MerR family transcriptional regulator, partial [Reyranella sp.]|uniref:MerR family transcriptional regulator n=1 Tax=Reyranella sp. TaxID=1929291 RepID=UPI00272FC7B3